MMGRLGSLCLCATLVILTVIAYLPVWHNDFINYDDPNYITENPSLQHGLSWATIEWAWTHQESPYWMPIAWLSLLVDAHFFSARGPEGEVTFNPAGFHAQGLFWHAGSTVLLFVLLNRLTAARWRSFLAAGLFALHPMHVESVAWAAERKDVLSVFFGLLTLLAYRRYLDRPAWPRYLLVLAAYGLSLLSKPMLITLPFVLLLLDYWPLRRLWPGPAGLETARPTGKPVSLGRLVSEKYPLFALAGLFAFLTLLTRHSAGALVSLETIPLSARLGNALTAYGWYLSATFYPTDLAALYPHPYGNWSLTGALVGAGCLLAITAFCLWQARRRPWLIVGWLWFVGCLLPVTGLAQGGGQAWADRFSYWPHIGLFIAVAWEAGLLVERFRIPVIVRAVAAALVLGSLAVLTWIQVGYWRDSITLWEHTLAVTEENARAHQFLSAAYRQAGRSAEADYHHARAFTIDSRRLRRPRPPAAPGPR